MDGAIEMITSIFISFIIILMVKVCLFSLLGLSS